LRGIRPRIKAPRGAFWCDITSGLIALGRVHGAALELNAPTSRMQLGRLLRGSTSASGVSLAATRDGMTDTNRVAS
ncbi:MAG: hypothetical protein ACRDU4_07580, partial [Mycobacterium sp.]